jgi:hypothetical protein
MKPDGAFCLIADRCHYFPNQPRGPSAAFLNQADQYLSPGKTPVAPRLVSDHKPAAIPVISAAIGSAKKSPVPPSHYTRVRAAEVPI